MANLEVLELLINSVSKSKDELISIDQLKEKLVDVQENELTPFFVPTTLAIGGNNVAIHRIYVRRKNCPSDGVGWVFNDDVTVCAICSEEFGFMTWRHHCRACGNIVCDACSSQTATIVEFQDLDVQRVCKQCCTNEVSMVAASNTRENEDYVDENAVPEPEVVEEVVPVAEEAEAEKVSSEDHDEYTLEVPSRPEGNRGAVHRYSMRLSQGLMGPPDVPNRHYESILQKKKPHGIGYQSRYCVLDTDGIFSYYTNEDEYKANHKPKGFFKIKNINNFGDIFCDTKLMISIGPRMYEFECSQVSVATNWCGAIWSHNHEALS